MSKNDTTTNKISGLDEALEDIKAGRIFEIEDWQAFSDQMEQEVINEI